MDRGLTRLALSLSAGLGAGLLFTILMQAAAPRGLEAATYWPGPIELPRLAPARPWVASTKAVVSEAAPTILFAGDIMLDRKVAERMRQSGDPSYPFRKLPDHWFDSFDYAVANLEGPVTDKRRSPEKSIDFLFDPSVIPTLKQTGIDAVSQANNHAFDQGRVGYDDSVSRLRAAGFLVFGEQVADGDVALATTTIRDTRYAFLGYNITDNPLNKQDAEPVLAKARASSDKVIVFMHWGTEYKDKPNADVVELAHWFIDHGVDVVIGGHPHWVQGISSYKGKPIAFSLGNFVFDQYFSVETQQGLAVSLTFRKASAGLTLYPMSIIESQPRVVTGEERTKRLKALAAISDEGLKEQIEAGNVSF